MRRGERDEWSTPLLDSSEGLSETNRISEPWYTWPVGLGVIFLVVWGAVMVVGVFDKAGSETEFPACEWDRATAECTLGAKGMEQCFQLSKESNGANVHPWIELLECIQQESNEDCDAHQDCFWDSGEQTCKSETFAYCMGAGVELPRRFKPRTMLTLDDPQCGTVGEYSAMLQACGELDTKPHCHNISTCDWDENESRCVVSDEAFAHLAFGGDGNSGETKFLHLRASCRHRVDEADCALVPMNEEGMLNATATKVLPLMAALRPVG
ncbi:unnamed protein product [Ostreobium quekettii]|uniref:Uncharacterized protein n=1 Tax=Ostreobium quekettii TaxID=121088 RepID=A0A8S1ISJ1_9CHLO|nr:unnamed protein product [Ostreobium quekettii]